VHELDFGGKPWQGKPKSGYWIPKEFHTWPEISSLTLAHLAVFVELGIRGSMHNTTNVPKAALRGESKAALPALVERGLLTPIHDKWNSYRIKTIGEMRQGRGTRGMVMHVSHVVPLSQEMCRAGRAAFGLWVLAASWSLTTPTPGYVTTEAALRFGKQKHVAALWDAGAWIAAEHGFLMHKRDHAYEMWWSLRRDDERAPIPPALRTAVFERDGWKCVKCGIVDDLVLDHIYPWSRGGPDTYDNLQVLCRPCNYAKGTKVEES
jgi:hypothetical protein